MNLTVDVLKKAGANQFIIDQFNNFNLEGGRPLISIMKSEQMSKDLLYWIFLHLSLEKNELKEYENILNINNSSGYYMSENLENSFYISKSNDIKNSSYVEESSRVIASTDIRNSKDVEESVMIINSDFCFSSEGVLESKNITNSKYIYNSNFVVNSNSVSNSSLVTNCSCVVNCTQIEESNFVDSCSNLKHCLFCHKINDKEFCLFNKEISKNNYEIIERQFERFIKLPLNIFYNYDLLNIKYNYDLSKLYQNLPKNFWEWTKTLPNYDPMILYNITFNSDVLE